MFEKISLIKIAQNRAAYESARMNVVARNITNADTPNFRAKDLPEFKSTYEDMGGPGEMKATRPRHFGSNAIHSSAASLKEVYTQDTGKPNGNNVSLETQMVKAVEAKQGHQMALAIYGSISDILKVSMKSSR